MATVDAITSEETLEVEEITPPSMEDIFKTDFNGEECVTEEGLDWIWPEDDREPLDIGGKGFLIPPTCEEQIPCYEKYGEQACLEFVFGGGNVTNIPQTPLAETGVFLITALVAVKLLKGTKK